jgi:microcystin degradation protein MlrC
MKRVGVGGFFHETNTFNPVPTTSREFQQRPGASWAGAELEAACDGQQLVLTGFARGLRAEGLAFVPLFFAMAGTWTGRITADAFEWAAGELEERVRRETPDALLLHLHGAAASDDYDDPETEILRRLRAVIGNRPIVTVNDAHANVGPAWLEQADVAIAYKTIPHLDMVERGEEGARIVGQMLRGEIAPTSAVRRPGILLKGGLMTLTEADLALIKPPMFWLARRAQEIERDPRVVNCSVNAGFGDADVPEAGVSVIVHTDRDASLAGDYADELAELAWRTRSGFDTSLVMMPVEQAVERSVHTDHWPVVLADEGNNTAGGSPGDGTTILAQLKAHGWPDAALFIRDEIAVREVITAGAGARVSLTVGGRHEPTNGDPCAIEGVVRLVAAGSPLRGELLSDPGETAVVTCGSTDVVLTQHPTSQTSAAHFRRVGIEPRERRITVVQSAAVFRHGFEQAERIARSIIEVDTPGITNPDPRRFEYRRVPRPVYPLDPDAPFAGSERRLVEADGMRAQRSS